jgi:hypothetical protein
LLIISLAYQCIPNNPFVNYKKKAKNPKNPFFIASNKLENPFCSKVKRKERTHHNRKARV